MTNTNYDPANLTPGQTWDVYVGEQSASEFVSDCESWSAIADSVVLYIGSSELFADTTPTQRDAIGLRLLAHIDAQLHPLHVARRGQTHWIPWGAD